MSTRNSAAGGGSGDIELNFGWMGAAAIGWGFGNGIRAEIEGNYRVEGQTITMEITDKPFVVPASVIEGQVRKFLSS